MHFYTQKGEPMHFVPCTTKAGSRPTTLADAKKLKLLPGVSTVLQTLAKPGLQQWIIMQNVMAALTTPRKAEESLDDFASRIMSEDAEAEMLKARNLGTDIHAGMEALFSGGQIDEELRPWIEPAYREVREMCPHSRSVEHVLVGDGYAGKADLLAWGNDNSLVVDFKSCKKIPDRPYGEARLQLSAYAKAWISPEDGCDISTVSVYISTTECGKFALFINPPWQRDYEEGFLPLLKVWKWINNV